MNETYAKNLAAIKKAYAGLDKWVDETVDVDWVRAHRDADKPLNILYTVNGALTPAYALDNPVENCDDLAEQAELHKESAVAIVGVGAGHLLKAFVDKMEKGCNLVVVEPIAHVLRLALGEYDFSEAIANHSMLIAPGKAEIEMALNYVESIKVVDHWGVIVDKIARTRGDYVGVLDYTIEILNQIQSNTGTVMTAGAKIADNDIASMPYVIRHRGVAELTGLFKDKPGIVVCTGPSLARNIHVLKEIHDRRAAVIVAVGQALRPLLAYDIHPDFICTVDFGEVNMTHYAGLCDEDVPLVTINKTYAPLLKTYRGPKFISAQIEGGYDDTAHAILKGKGALGQGGSVAHMAFCHAVSLGCSPILFVGQDLALGEASHIALADSSGKVEVVDGQIKWKINDVRSTTLHARDDIGMGPAQRVPGYFGEDVLTNAGLLTFITAMEKLVEVSGRRVFNCTEGGAHIRGVKRMFLADAAEKFCTQAVDKSAVAPLLTPAADGDALIDTVVPLLEKDVKILDIIIEQSRLGVKTIMAMRNTTKQEKLLKLLAKNNLHSNAAHEGARRLPLVAMAILGASRRIQTRELNVNADPKFLAQKANRKDLLTRLTRNEIILVAARDAAASIKETYAETLALLGRYQRGERDVLDASGESTAASIADANHYFDAGNWARPLLEARRILADSGVGSVQKEAAYEVKQRAYVMRSAAVEKAREEQAADLAAGRNTLVQYLDLIEEAQIVGRDAKDFGKALPLLEAAAALRPDKEQARWGQASCLHKLDRHDEAVAAYRKLVADFPDSAQYQMELGQCLWSAEATWEEGMAIILALVNAHPQAFTHFLAAMGQVYEKYGKPVEALECYEKHMLIVPYDEEIRERVEALKK